MPQVVTELTGGVASYVARLPMPAVDATEWAKTVRDDSPVVSPELSAPEIVEDNQAHTSDVTSEIKSDREPE